MENLNSSDGFSFSILPSFWILAIIAILTKQGYIFGMYTISVLIHEFAHFFVAKKLLYNSKSIKLSAFGAILYGEFDNVERVDSIKIAIAGPLINIVLATLVVACWWICPSLYDLTTDFAISNISLALINLLPCYPLDGGRVFVGLLQKKMGFIKALKLSRFLSVCSGCIFFVIFLIGILLHHNLYSCGLFGFFLTLIGAGETKRAVYGRKIYMGTNKSFAKKGLEKKCLVFDGDNTLCDIVKKLKDNYFYQLTIWVGEDKFFILEQPQINYCLMTFTLDTPLKNLIKYKA